MSKTHLAEGWAEAISDRIGQQRGGGDPETQLWLDDEKRYGPPVARMRHKMRQQGIKPERVVSVARDLRAGAYVYMGEQFSRLVRPRTQPGKGWFAQGGNPRYLDSLPQAQIDSALTEYRRLVETMERVDAQDRPSPARGRDIREELDYQAIQEQVGQAALTRGGYGWKSVQDEALGLIYDLQGYHGKPEVLTEAEMDRRIANGWIEVWRGFGAPPGGVEYAEAFRSGDRHYAGLGVHGNGTYTAFGSDAAYQAGTYTVDPPGSGGPIEPRAMVRMAIPPEAKLINMLDVAHVHEVRGDFGIRDPLRAARGRVLSDGGRLAAAMGYDGMALERDGRGVYVIFNRSMLAVQEG